MYERFFGFKDQPFRLTPDPRYLYLGSKHREGYAHLLYALKEGSGFVAVTGEVGTGKTTLVRALLREADENVAVAYIFNPVLTAVELLQTINAEFGLPAKTASKKDLSDALNAFLLTQRAEGGRTVIIVDEAQNLEPAVLEQMRLLSNMETETEKLLQIVLLGQPELRSLLNRNDLRQLSQRIDLRWNLDPLDRAETHEYVRHRVGVAGGQSDTFQPKALDLIYDQTGGVPRLINILAHRALLVSYTKGLTAVGPAEVSLAAMELEEGRVPLRGTRANWVYRAAGGVGVAVAAGTVAFLMIAPLGNETSGLIRTTRTETSAAPSRATQAAVSARARDVERNPAGEGSDAPQRGAEKPSASGTRGAKPGGTQTASTKSGPAAGARPGGAGPNGAAAAPVVVASARPADSAAATEGSSRGSKRVRAAKSAKRQRARGDRAARANTAHIRGAAESAPPSVAAAASEHQATAARAEPADRAAVSPAAAAGATEVATAKPQAATRDAIQPEPASLERMVEALAKRPAFDTAAASISRLLDLWSGRALAKPELAGDQLDLEKLARKRGLSYLGVAIDFPMLARLDLPAILELRLPGGEVRHVLLEHFGNDRAELMLNRPVVISRADLESIWSGRAHLVWKDAAGLHTKLAPGSRGVPVSRLQSLLAAAGVLEDGATGIYDADTENAVKRFQAANDLPPDGVADAVTQILLYNAAGRFERPSLARVKAGRRERETS
jgi:general secretion pathway protein A